MTSPVTNRPRRGEATGLLRLMRVIRLAPNNRRVAGDEQVPQRLTEDVGRFVNRPDTTFKCVAPLPTPPGNPIGGRGGRQTLSVRATVDNSRVASAS
jgi:hypothetical protein